MLLKIFRPSWRGLWYCPCNSLQALGKTITHFISDSPCPGRSSILALRCFTSRMSELSHYIDLLQRQAATVWSGVSAEKLSFSCLSSKQVILCLFRCVRRIVKINYWLRHVGLSVRPSVCMEQLDCQWTAENIVFEYFSKICRENSSFSEICQE